MFFLLLILSPSVTCFTSSSTCSDAGFTCSQDYLVDYTYPVLTEEECQTFCSDNPECTFYTWYKVDNVDSHLECDMFSSCDIQESCTNCFTGPKVCPECSSPADPDQGTWFCTFTSTISLNCFLECDPGYVSIPRSVTSCLNAIWTTPPRDMSCTESLALITGDQSVEIYSGNGSCNHPLPDLPDNRVYHTVDYVDGEVLLCGGNDQDTRRLCLEMDLKFSLFWFKHSETLMSRYFHSSVVTAGQLTLIGGQSYEAKNNTEVMEIGMNNGWSSGYNLMEESNRACSVKVSHDSYMVTGGQHFPNDVVLYNVTDGIGRKLQSLHKGRSDHGCAFIRNDTFSGVLVTGGEDNNSGEFLSSTEMYDIMTGQWKEVGRMTSSRRGVKMVVLPGRILAMGGEDEDYNSLASVEQFDLGHLTWEGTMEMLEPRYFHAVTAVPRNMFNCTQI